MILDPYNNDANGSAVVDAILKHSAADSRLQRLMRRSSAEINVSPSLLMAIELI
jgi:hypothetical protein